MKKSQILLVALFLSQSLGLNAHAVDAETLAKAKAWAAEQQAKAKASGQAAEDEKKAKEKVQQEQQAQAEKAAKLKAQQEAAAKKKAQEEAEEKAELEGKIQAEAEEKAEAKKLADAAQQAQADKEAKAKKAADEAAAKQAQEAAKGSQSTTLNYSSVVDIGSYKGTTFFSLMEKVIKPELDRYATEGFHIVDGAAVESFLSRVDVKVSRAAIRAAGSLDRLKEVANRLSALGTAITFHNIPQTLLDLYGKNSGLNLFDLQEFFGLASKGGVAVRVMDGVYSYNVNYGTGKITRDAQSGRSFGEAAGRLARDASDADHLQMLERYVRSSGPNTAKFYQSLLEILANNDVQTFPEISKEGQIIASDFLAVYVAEQDRHLMVNLEKQHWDRALLEVTLLSAFHGGQSEVMVMYGGQLTGTTYKQAKNCIVPNVPPAEKIPKKAGMLDYWQFSSNTDKDNCVRSGINLTNKDFRKLDRLISSYERHAHPELVQKVERHFKGIQLTGGLIADLSNFLIRYQTPKSLDAKTLELPTDFTRFLMQVRADADDITASILQNQ